MMARPVTVITGASRGIGRQLSVDLARDGWDVVCVARTTSAHPSKLPGTVEETCAAVEQSGGRAMAVGLDVQDEDACAALAERVYGEWGRCDLLINNAAVAPPKPALDDSIRRWRMAVDVNLNGPFYLTWHFGRRMIANGTPGRVMNVSSAAAVMPEFGRPSYTATKLGLEGLTQALGHELKGKVAVNCIRIDFPIWTEGFDATLPDGFDTTGFEDPVVMTDAVLWLAKQDLDYTAKVLTLMELRRQGILRPETPVVR
jgi:3-oxoacyl-[acyl-carrier protein] reductase